MTILTGTPDDDTLISGSTDDTLYGEDGDDLLDGGAGADSLFGGSGADTLIGSAAGALTADTLAGGTGDDVYEITDGSDVVTEAAGEGIDEIRTTLAVYTLTDQVEALSYTGSGAFAGTGNALANTIHGGDGADTLDGGAGADTLIGGAGSDLYLVDDADDVVIELADEGLDEVRMTLAVYALGDNLEILTAVGNGAFSGTGNDLDNRITGGAGNDTLAGGAGNDTLDGGAGADSLIGGIGNDLYIVDDAGDAVAELAGEGTDEVRTTLATYTLGANVENLTYTGTGAFSGTGNASANTITGGAGNDTLDGGAGADTLVGGIGNDVYVVDNAGDVVTELAGQGADEVRTALASYTLTDNVEILTYTGSGTFIGTGTSLANTITGGSGADSLSGSGGNDTLDGAVGADTLAGGTGNDTFIVDDAGDVVVELAGEGTDTVRTGLSSYTLGANVENLVYTGTDPFTATGNALNNSLAGGTGNDVLVGLEGNDTLNGGAGADTMTGGTGNDVYVVDNVGDVVVELPGEGTDTVQSSIAYTLLDDFENLTLTGGGAVSGTGNAANNALTGNGAANTLYGLDGNDTLNGGGGADTLIGGTGNDSYMVDNVNDVVTELAGEGTDTVSASVSYTLSVEVETLTLTGSGSINGTGNELANALTGNGGANLLDGGLGADTMAGGGGNDVYLVDAAGDVVTEAAGQGTDEVRTTLASYTLTANVENLTYTGSGTFAGTGNGLDNRLVGGAGADTLDGGAGTDTVSYAAAATGVTADLSTGSGDGGDALVSIENLAGSAHDDALTGDGNANLLDGGTGNDALSGGGGDDTLVGGAGADMLTGGSGTDTASYAAAAGAVAVDLAAGTGTAGEAAGDVLSGIENLVGSAGNDTLRGDAGANWLDGGGGDDLLEGRGGNDTLVGGAGLDTAVFSGNARDYVATLSGGTWTIAGADGTDTLQGVEQAQFVDGLIYLDGRNNAPMLAGTLTGTTDEDAAPLAVDLLQGAWDFDSNPLSVTGFGQTGGPAATVSLTGGMLTLNPAQFGGLAAGQSAVLDFAFGVFDGVATVARTLSVTVAGRNDAPVVAGPVNATTDEDAAPLVVALLQGASDPDQDDSLSVTGFSQTGGRTVSVTRTGGTLTLDPAQFNDLAAGQSATLTFDYGVMDGTATTAQTLNVTVQGRNDAPVAQNDQFAIWKNTPKQLTTGMLLANDSDADSGDVLSITSVSGATNGSVTLDSQGHVLFTPATGATGAASFKYTVSDGHGGTTEGNVSLSIQDAASATDNPLSVATLYNQYDPTAITLANGNTLAVWWSYNGTDQKVHAMARRFDPSGNLIDTNTDLDLGEVVMPYDTYFLPMIGHLRATALSGGGFMLEYLGKAGSTTRVSLQRYDDNGTKLNGAGGTTNPVPIQMNTDTWSYVVMPRVAVLQDGRYMAIGEVHDAGNQGDIIAQVFNQNGTVSSGQFRVNTTTLWHQMYPEVTKLTDGGFVVTWNSGKADTGNVVAFQRFSANGLRVGGETRVSEQSGTQEWPTISALPDGGWVTVWQRAALGSSDYSVQGQIFNADGSRRGSGFTVNQLDAGAQGMPRVSVMADGGFVVSWNSQALGRDVGADQWARRFDRQGNALTDEFRINVTTTGDQTLSSLAPLSDGRFLAFYTNPDSSYEGVSWRLFGPRPAIAGTLEGTGGADTLIGTGGVDEIIAYGGNDVLSGQGGNDILTGGAGADSFRFNGLVDGIDTITDFQPGTDRIEVVGAAFGNLPTGQLAAGRFALNAPTDADDRFVFNTTTGALSYDPDGNGAMAATTLALLNVRSLAASDIWVVASA